MLVEGESEAKPGRLFMRDAEVAMAAADDIGPAPETANRDAVPLELLDAAPRSWRVRSGSCMPEVGCALARLKLTTGLPVSRVAPCHRPVVPIRRHVLFLGHFFVVECPPKSLI